MSSGFERIDRAEAGRRLPRFEEMLRLALLVQARARAPYSGFHVGAAVLGGSGQLYPGCNVESASYGATICAERGALMSAIAAGETELSACVIVTPTAAPSSPCGICRQLLMEFGPNLEVYAATTEGEAVTFARLGDLLPLAFSVEDLGGASETGPTGGTPGGAPDPGRATDPGRTTR